MTLLDFLALALASHALVDAWRNGSLFEELRAYFEARSDDAPPELPSLGAPATSPIYDLPIWMRILNGLCPRWLAELLSCWFCFSHHTPWLLAVSLYFPSLFVIEPWDFLLKLPVYSLAATRLGSIINAVLPREAQYDRAETEFIEEPTANDEDHAADS